MVRKSIPNDPHRKTRITPTPDADDLTPLSRPAGRQHQERT